MPKGRNETGPNHWLTHLGAATQHVRKRWRGRSQWPVSRTGVRLGPSEIHMGPPWVKSAALNVDHALSTPLSGPPSEPRLTSQKGLSRRSISSSQLESYSGNPAFRSPSINSFAFDCPLRAIHPDIVKEGSTSSRRAAAFRASTSRPRWAKADARQR